MYVYNTDRGWSKEVDGGMRRAASEIRIERFERGPDGPRWRSPVGARSR